MPFPKKEVLEFPDGGKPTEEWIGNPSEQDIGLFLNFLFNYVATCPPGKGKHQSAQIEGPFRAYSTPRQYQEPRKRKRKTIYIRGSDFSRRIYAGVTFLVKIVGDTCMDACITVADWTGGRLGASKRGRPRKAKGKRDLFSRMETVRSLYNAQKKRHRWPEKLPTRDLELEDWWGSFLSFKDWRNEVTKRTRPKTGSRGMVSETPVGQ